MADGGTGGACAPGTTFVLAASARQGLLDTNFNVALGLPADGCQLRDNKITRALKHPLLAERERLEMAQEREILEHLGDFKNIACTHLLGKIFETIFPIIGGG